MNKNLFQKRLQFFKNINTNKTLIRKAKRSVSQSKKSKSKSKSKSSLSQSRSVSQSQRQRLKSQKKTPPKVAKKPTYAKVWEVCNKLKTEQDCTSNLMCSYDRDHKCRPKMKRPKLSQKKYLIRRTSNLSKINKLSNKQVRLYEKLFNNNRDLNSLGGIKQLNENQINMLLNNNNLDKNNLINYLNNRNLRKPTRMVLHIKPKKIINH